MMNQEIKTKWLEALRSGRYTQTKGVLRNSEGYCCIGVLCDIVDPDKWLGADEETTRAWGDELTYGNLPLKIQEELGVLEHCDLLPSLNDKGTSFADIADIIESDDIEGGYKRIKSIS